MTLAALIFDVDGTLADTEELHREAFNAAFAEHALPWNWSRAVYAELLKTTGGKERIAAYVNAQDALITTRDQWKARIPDIHRSKTAHFTRRVDTGALALRPGVRRLLAEARAAGVPLAVASTTTRDNIVALLANALGPDAPGWFAVIAAGDEVPRKKPAPDIYELVLRTMGARAGDCIAFEDSGRGLAAAKAAGLYTVVTPTWWTREDNFAAADLVLPSLGDPEDPLPEEDARRAGNATLGIAELRRLLALRGRVASRGPVGRVQRAAPARMHAEGRIVPAREKTLTEFIIEEQRRYPQATGDFTALLNYVRLACKRISFLIGRGALGGVLGAAGAVNVQGEAQARLDVIANDIFIRTSEYGGHLCAMASEEMEAPYVIPPEFPRGKYLLAFDPLDGSSNIDVNVSVGSIFSVLQRPDGAGEPSADEFLQPGARQLCAGYAIYGPTTMLVLTLGRGVHGFTLDPGFGEFILTHRDLRIPEETSEFAINASNERFWEPPVKRYVAECLAGRGGPRGKDFNMRWIASLVAEVHRILVRGGLFMYPRDTKDATRPGRLRLLYEANPMAMIVEQAGGAASTGTGHLLDVVPTGLHQRVPVILGSKAEVERIERYHAEHEQGLDRPFSSPLFNERSLYVQG